MVSSKCNASTQIFWEKVVICHLLCHKLENIEVSSNICRYWTICSKYYFQINKEIFFEYFSLVFIFTENIFFTRFKWPRQGTSFSMEQWITTSTQWLHELGTWWTWWRFREQKLCGNKYRNPLLGWRVL